MPLDTSFPKSTAKLRPGDVCFVPRSDGRFVPFAYVCPQGNARSYFFGGLVNIIVDVPQISVLPGRVSVKEYALVHIHCFEKNETPVVGNIADRISSEVLDKIRKESHCQDVGSTTNVWGYRTIVNRANAIGA